MAIADIQETEYTSEVTNHLNDSEFLEDVLEGFTSQQKNLSPKYFYDELGSQYFDEICDLQEYYPYKTELKLLQKVAKELGAYIRDDVAVIEFGAGALQKIRPLFENNSNIKRFLPIDISGEFLVDCVKQLQKGFPAIEMHPIIADFCEVVKTPESIRERKLGFFPGSTIGNFTPEQAVNFLTNARKTLGDDGALLIGVDTKKSPAILHRAYNDALGVTEKFNLNLLNRINRELDGTLNVDHFEHYAFYNANLGRIEMHLICNSDHKATISDVEVSFRSGETIHTECSYKYTPDEFSALIARAGWKMEAQWLADDSLFATYLIKPIC